MSAVVHVAGFPASPKYFGENALVEVEANGGVTRTSVIAAIDGELPRNCCAKEPVKLRSVT